MKRLRPVGVALSLLIAHALPAHALVTTGQIANGAVTAPKIANNAVTATKIATGAVTNAKIGNLAVTAAKIASGAVTPRKLSHYARVIVVAPSGGDFTSPVDAMNFLANPVNTGGTAPSPDNPYLVKIMPGVYPIGTGTVRMLPFVDIEGSGRETTSIAGTVSTPDPASPDPANPRPLHGVVTGSSHATLRNLTVENTGACPTGTCAATAILASDCEIMSIENVGAEAIGGNHSVGIIVRRTSDAELGSVIIRDSEALAQGANYSTGILVEGRPGVGDFMAGIVGSVTNAVGAPPGNSHGLELNDATVIVLGSFIGSDGDTALAGRDYRGWIENTHLGGGEMSVTWSGAHLFPLSIANCTTDEGGIFTVTGATVLVTNSHLEQGLALSGSPTVTLLNSSAGEVTMDSGTFKAANSALGGSVTATGGTAACAAATRTDTFATLDGGCQ